MDDYLKKKSNTENSFDDNSIDDFVEYLESVSRTTPTTMPEWMN